jgi:hypothetical protein
MRVLIPLLFLVVVVLAGCDVPSGDCPTGTVYDARERQCVLDR